MRCVSSTGRAASTTVSSAHKSMHIGAAVRQGIFLSSQRNHKSRLTGAAAGISACFDKDRISCSSRRHFLPPRCCFPAVSRTITITMADLPYKEFVLENGARARLYNGATGRSIPASLFTHNKGASSCNCIDCSHHLRTMSFRRRERKRRLRLRWRRRRWVGQSSSANVPKDVRKTRAGG